MTAALLQRFRECQNLLDSVVANVSAINNLNSQRMVVEYAMRRAGVSSSSSVALPRCCTDPLGMFLAFPESSLDLVLAQHNEDINALLCSISKSQQMWHSKLQQAKELLHPRQSQAEDRAAAAAFFWSSNYKEREGGKDSRPPQVKVGEHALLAVLAQMHGWLHELTLALREDLANRRHAVQLSMLLNRCYSSQPSGMASCVSAMSLEAALGQLESKIRLEWETCKAQHMVDEAWIMLAS